MAGRTGKRAKPAGICFRCQTQITDSVFERDHNGDSHTRNIDGSHRCPVQQSPAPITVEEWHRQATERFGDDLKNWKFQCPVCGHIQSPPDFAAIGKDPQSCYQLCIGRYLPSCARDLATKPAQDGSKSPCDFAAFGLFKMSPAPSVIPEDGKDAVPVFPFAPVEEKV